MIAKKEATRKTWTIIDEDQEIVGNVCLDSGEVLITVCVLAPELSYTKEFHKALGEAIAEAEKYEEQKNA